MAIMNPYNYKKPDGAQVVKNPNDMSVDPSISSASKSRSDAYLEQKIMNARPEELTMMLFDGLVKFITQVIMFNEQNSVEKSHNANLRAQAILQELRSTLNMEIEISQTLEQLYLYMIERLIDGNLNKRENKMEEVLELATDLRDTWKEAMNL